jgi:hypothetical protein
MNSLNCHSSPKVSVRSWRQVDWSGLMSRFSCGLILKFALSISSRQNILHWVRKVRMRGFDRVVRVVGGEEGWC